MRAGLVSTGLATRRKVKRFKLEHARQMRDNPTPAEALLWERLRMGRLGFKFRRQALVRGYIADFWCPKVKLVVEADGGYHDARAELDALRDRHLAAIGIRTLRFQNERVVEALDDVCTEIFHAACERLRVSENARRSKPQRASREAAGSKAGKTPSPATG